MSDPLLFHEPDGGNVKLVGGSPVQTNGIETAVYLSLFGGNEDDSGLAIDDSKQWWANPSIREPAQRYRAETQNLIRSLPATPNNILRLEDAVLRDLAWMSSDPLNAKVSASVRIPAVSRWEVNVEVEVSGDLYRRAFVLPSGVKS